MNKQKCSEDGVKKFNEFWAEMKRLNPGPKQTFKLSDSAVNKLLEGAVCFETHQESIEHALMKGDDFAGHIAVKTIGKLMREKLKEIDFIAADFVSEESVVVPVEFLKWLIDAPERKRVERLKHYIRRREETND